MENVIKGAEYEQYILDYLKDSADQIWLWQNIPEQILVDIGFIQDLNKHRRNRIKAKNNNKPNPLIDTGIDILKIKDDVVVAIQCKCYTKNVRIKDLAGFYMTVANHPNYCGEVYYTSGLSKHIVENAINRQISYILKPFDKDNTETLTSENKRYKLYDYQQEIIDKHSKKFYKKNDRGILNMPCGTGKTLLSYHISKGYNIIIIFSPLKQFAEQNRTRFEQYDPKLKTLLIDSEGERSIKNIMKFITNNTDHNIVLSTTYKSADVVDKILNKIEGTVFIIIDEFHNLSKNNIVNEGDDMCKILKSNHKFLFMSATPRVYQLENDDTDEIDDIFGKIIYKMSIEEAITKRYITDYKIYLPLITENKKKNIKKIQKEINVDDIEEKKLLQCMYLLKGMTFYGNRKCIVYTQTIREAKEFIENVQKINKYYACDLIAETITQQDNQNNRTIKIDKFEKHNGIAILCSVQILNECIDIPKCDAIFITYNSKSKINNVQRLCRAVRLDKSKPTKVASIYLWCDEYTEISDFLASVKEYDSEYYNKISITNIDYDKTVKDYEEVIEDERIKLNDFIVGIKEYKIIPRSYWIKKLKRFIKKCSKTPSMASKNIKEKILGKWCSRQRELYKKGFLLENEIDQLEKIKYWYWRKNASKGENICEFIKFVEQNKRLPQPNIEDKIENKLHKWYLRQQQDYRNDKMPKAKYKKLNKISYWVWIEHKKCNQYTDNIKDLQHFQKKNNKIPSHASKDPLEKRLGHFCTTYRMKKRKNELTEEQIKEFESIDGWKWDFVEKVSIRTKYNKIKEFIEISKKLPSSISINLKEKQLGQWCSFMRKIKRENKLSEKYVKKFNKIKGWYWNDNTIKYCFSEQIEKVRDFKKNNNDNFPSSASENNNERSLGYWCTNRRRDYWKNKLSDTQIKQLENIKGWYWNK